VSTNLVRGSVYGGIIASILGVPVVYAEFTGYGAWEIFILGATAIAILASGVALLAMLFKRYRSRAGQTIVFSVVFVVTSAAYLVGSSEARDDAFARLSERSDSLITAIEAYETAYGHPPETLKALVPSYLKSIPRTLMPAYPDYVYQVFPRDAPTKHYWYDLGSREEEGFSGLWKYPDGDPGHAVHRSTTDRAGKVLYVDTDRMPLDLEEQTFDASLWFDRTNRMAMVRGSATIRELAGQAFTEVISLLGSPDQERTVLDAEWELRVPCSSGFLNWDVFFYWPNESYSDYIYGGIVERIGKWAYVHE